MEKRAKIKAFNTSALGLDLLLINMMKDNSLHNVAFICS